MQMAGFSIEHGLVLLIATAIFGVPIWRIVARTAHRARRQLTTEAMSSPSGMSWQGRGVVPDILMSADPHEKGELGEITTDKQLMAAIARLKRP
jgi:C-terminal processing protease CtpA/Prc